MNTLLAIPSSLPGGLDAPLAQHFGHCDCYTLIQIRNGEVQNVQILPGLDHQEGGCLAPVQHLAQQKVQAIISGGMGMRPLHGFQDAGISVYYAGGMQTVKSALAAFLQGTLQSFGSESACQGGCSHH